MSDETEKPTKTEDEVEGHSFNKPLKPVSRSRTTSRTARHRTSRATLRVSR